MPFSFESPFALALLAAIPGAVWLARRSLSGLGRVRRILAVALRSIILALVALAIAGLQVERTSERIACIFLVDRSSSIPPDRREASLPFIVQAVERSRARRPDDLAGVIAFGARPGIEVGPRRDFFFDGFYTVIDPDGTDIASAIRLGAGSFPPGSARRMVLITDGNETAGRAIDEARAAGTRGISIDVVPIRYAYEPEVRLEKIVVPEGIRAGEPFEIRAVVSATHEGRGTLRIFENGRIVDSREVTYGPGRTVFAATLRREEPGAYRYEAQIEPGEDSLPANNLAHGFAVLRGQPKVLYCAGGRERGAGPDRLPAALRDEGIAIVPVSPGSLPLDPESYIGFDTLVLDDVHAADLGTERMEFIHGLVRDIGLGLVAVGGPDAFGAGGYGGTALEKALPVTMDLRGKKILPNGALVLIFHTCEFPAGNDWAKKIAKAAIEVLSPRDLVGVLHYGRGEEWLFPIQPADPAGMFPLIDGMFAGDMPDFDVTLDMAGKGLAAAAASIKHIVIISDGDPTPASAGVLSALVNGRITASTVFISSHGGVEAAEGQRRMQLVAATTGGRFWPLALGDVGKLPQIFIREATEVRRAVIVEEPFVPRVVQPSPIIRGIDAGAIPRLLGYVATTPKDLADVILRSHQDDPILAAWRCSLGKAVAFTSDATARWAQEWLGWPEYRKLWAQAVRWASRGSEAQGFRVSRESEGPVTRVIVDAVDEEGRFVNYLRLSGRSLDSRGRGEEISFRQIGPGRYAAEVPASAPGTTLVNIAWKDPGGEAGSFVTGVSVPYSREYRDLGTNDLLLEEIARAANGRVADPESVLAGGADPYRRDLPTPVESRPVWPSLLIWAAWLMLADVFVRRVAIDWARLWAWVVARAAALAGRARRERVADPRLQALLRTKATVRARAMRGAEPALPEAPVEAAPPVDAGEPVGSIGAGESKAAPEEKGSGEKEPGYTQRLLRAKRRAIRREEGES